MIIESCIRRQRLLSGGFSRNKKVGDKKQRLVKFSPLIMCPKVLLTKLAQITVKQSRRKTLGINDNYIIDKRYEFGVTVQSIANERLHYIDEASFRFGSIISSICAAICINGLVDYKIIKGQFSGEKFAIFIRSLPDGQLRDLQDSRGSSCSECDKFKCKHHLHARIFHLAVKPDRKIISASKEKAISRCLSHKMFEKTKVKSAENIELLQISE